MGRHADVADDQVGAGALIGFFLREGLRVVFGGIVMCVVLPLLALFLAPLLIGDGHDMTKASTCASSGETGCLETIEATIGKKTSSFPAKWTVGEDSLYFPALDDSLSAGDDANLLLWGDAPVAVADPSGKVIESLDWGWSAGFAFWAMILLPIWGVVVFVFSWVVNRSKRIAGAGIVTRILAVGTILAGPGAYLGVLLIGHRGLFAGGVLVIAVALIVAGIAAGSQRRAGKRADSAAADAT